MTVASKREQLTEPQRMKEPNTEKQSQEAHTKEKKWHAHKNTTFNFAQRNEEPGERPSHDLNVNLTQSSTGPALPPVLAGE